MANIIKIKGKTTTGAPALGDLAVRELCFVLPDNELYIKKDAGTIINLTAAGGSVSDLIDLTDVGSSTPTNRNVLVADGSLFQSRPLTEADISDLQSYLTASGINTLAKLNAIVGDATLKDASDLATAAQGALASSAIQPGDNISVLNNDANFADQSYVNTAISNLVGAAPGTLDTLNELAAALGDDPNFSATVTASLATKLDENSIIDGGTIS
jgi:hypothetical protein